MENRHDPDNYTAVDDPADNKAEEPAADEKNKKQSDAYYYVDVDEDKLKEYSSIRTILTVLAVLLQIVPLILPQGGLEFVATRYPSYAYAYTWLVLVMLGISVWLIIMTLLRYKIAKRIPAKFAPKSGFGKRVYFGTELFMPTNAVIFILELSFVCFKFDGYGFVGMILSALALCSSIAARQVTHAALKSAVLVDN